MGILILCIISSKMIVSLIAAVDVLSGHMSFLPNSDDIHLKYVTIPVTNAVGQCLINLVSHPVN